MVQLSHLYMTNGKTIALTTQTFVGKTLWGIVGWGIPDQGWNSCPLHYKADS